MFVTVSYTHLDVYKRQDQLNREAKQIEEEVGLNDNEEIPNELKIRMKKDVYKRQLEQIIKECVKEEEENVLAEDKNTDLGTEEEKEGSTYFDRTEPVSYTHLDVYKRQV